MILIMMSYQRTTTQANFINKGGFMKTEAIEIVRKAKLNRVHEAIAQAYLYQTELKRKIALRKVLKEMRLASRRHK